MNSREQIMARLLRLFPKEQIKEYFGEKTTKKNELLLKVIKTTTDPDILSFVHESTDYSKQHVYLFSCDIPDYGSLPEQLIPGPTLKTEIDGKIEYNCLFRVTYKVYFQEAEKRPIDLVFQWPIHIIVGHSLAIVSFTILEKNIQSYFPDATVLTTRKTVDEKQIIGLVVNGLNSVGVPVSHDLNKGIKTLWESDVIDAIDVQYRKANSISKEVMDEEYTFKRQYPEQYKIAIQSPLGKTSFKFINSNGEYCDHFTIDPTNGEITFPLFSKSKEQTHNVIQKILELN
jgi:hypothetical protein